MTDNITMEPFQARLGWFRDPDKWVGDPHPSFAYINLFAIVAKRKEEWRPATERTLGMLSDMAGGRPIVVNTSMQYINLFLIKELTGRLEVTDVDELLDCVTLVVSVTHKMHGKIFEAEPFPRYNIAIHPGIVRTGIVELRVIENFLRDPGRLRSALRNVVRDLDDEAVMYEKGSDRSWCTADDYEWNIKRLMTNAGFYVSRDPISAWRALEDWSERYIAAMRRNDLASHIGTYLFCFATQQMLWRQSQTRLTYVWHPDAFGVYEQIKGRRVLFVSPLAHLVAEQYSSGRIWNLYKSREVPRFELATAGAWISTWPNRPHADWSETFNRLCEEVDTEARKRPFDVFISSCGCYGLPLSDYVREKHGASVIYLGNITNAFFGVLQRASLEFMQGHQNVEAFVRGDLGKFTNIDLIDGGRYT